MGIENLINAMSANYDEARNTAKSFTGEKVPEGQYEMKLFPIKFNEKEKDGEVKVSLQRNFTVLSGEHQGMAQMDFMQLGHKVGLSFAMQFIAVMGYEIPESPADWPEVIEAINEEAPLVLAEVVHSGDFVNVRVLEVLEADDDTESDDEAEAEMEAEAEAEAEGNAGPTVAELKKVIKDEGLGIRVKKGTPPKDILALIEKARAEKADGDVDADADAGGATVAELIKWAGEHGIEDLDPDATVEETVAELLDYELEEDEILEGDEEFMEANGLSAMAV